MNVRSTELQDSPVNIRVKLASLWTSVMLCYIYGDIFSFFKTGTLQDILAGNTGAFGTQTGLLSASLLMAIPSVMVFLSLVLAAKVGRWANVVLGIAYTIVIVGTMVNNWAFYLFLGLVEAVLTLTIAVLAWRWPKVAENSLD